MTRDFDVQARGLGRRHVLGLAAASAAASILSRPALAEDTPMPAPTAKPMAKPMETPVQAIAFDGFVIFDSKPVFALCQTLFPGKGEALAALWRTRQFEYCWLRTLTGDYADFWTVTGNALAYAAATLKLELTGEKRDRLMQAWLELKAHPDVKPALRTLREAGIRLGFLSNLTEAMLKSAIASAGLDGYFEQLLSTDRVRAYKPDPRAYGMGIDGFGLRREEIVFAAFGGWDANGAKTFGYRTYWADRLKLPAEELGATPDATGDGMAGLLRFVTGR